MLKGIGSKDPYQYTTAVVILPENKFKELTLKQILNNICLFFIKHINHLPEINDCYITNATRSKAESFPEKCARTYTLLCTTSIILAE